jgi:hypothetical protein
MKVSFASILEDVLARDAPDLRREVAEWLLHLRFTNSQKRRQIHLADLRNRGELSSEQSKEMASYRQIGNLFSLLHAKARLSLRQPLTSNL